MSYFDWRQRGELYTPEFQELVGESLAPSVIAEPWETANGAEPIDVLLEVDGESLIGIPLLERKRHLEGLVTPSPNVRLTAFVTRGLRPWRETLSGLGLKRVLLKDWNSPYSAGQTAGSWLIVDKLNPPKMK